MQLTPKYRFGGFNEIWTEDKLKSIFNIKAGGDINKKNISPFKTDIFKYPIYANAKKKQWFIWIF